MSTSCAFIHEKSFKDFSKLPKYEKEVSFFVSHRIWGGGEEAHGWKSIGKISFITKEVLSSKVRRLPVTASLGVVHILRFFILFSVFEA